MTKAELTRALRKESARLAQARGAEARMRTALNARDELITQLQCALHLSQGQTAAREEQHTHIGMRIRNLLRTQSGELAWNISVALTEVGL